MTITNLESNHISEINKILSDRSIETFGYSPQSCEPESLYNNEFQEVTTVVVIDVSLPVCRPVMAVAKRGLIGNGSSETILFLRT